MVFSPRGKKSASTETRNRPHSRFQPVSNFASLPSHFTLFAHRVSLWRLKEGLSITYYRPISKIDPKSLLPSHHHHGWREKISKTAKIKSLQFCHHLSLWIPSLLAFSSAKTTFSPGSAKGKKSFWDQFMALNIDSDALPNPHGDHTEGERETVPKNGALRCVLDSLFWPFKHSWWLAERTSSYSSS